MIRHNGLKQALKRGSLQLGLWCALANNVTAELVAASDYDWLTIDMEHSPNDLRSVMIQLQVMAAYPAEALVRLPNTNRSLLKQLLDTGARSLIFPAIESAEEAADIVASTRYPMRGTRGVAGQQRANRYGRVPDYHRNAETDIFLAMQIESPSGAANAVEIAEVDGVDALFVGPSDLAATMGHMGRPGDVNVQRTIAAVGAAARAAGKAAGTLAVVEADARHWIESGFTMVGIGSDQGLLARSCDELVKRFKPGA